MILLFGEKAHRSGKNSNIKNQPVENSGILAMNRNNAKSLFDTNEYDTCEFSTPAFVDYTMFGEGTCGEVAFLGGFAEAFSALSSSGFEGGFGSFGGGDCGCSCSSSSFSSVC